MMKKRARNENRPENTRHTQSSPRSNKYLQQSHADSHKPNKRHPSTTYTPPRRTTILIPVSVSLIIIAIARRPRLLILLIIGGRRASGRRRLAIGHVRLLAVVHADAVLRVGRQVDHALLVGGAVQARVAAGVARGDARPLDGAVAALGADLGAVPVDAVDCDWSVVAQLGGGRGSSVRTVGAAEVLSGLEGLGGGSGEGGREEEGGESAAHDGQGLDWCV